jgi:uncharacterized membrane protein YhaH (DUF805 family)
VGWNEPIVRASPLAAIRRFWSHYFEFSGRASVAEYWFWGLANLLVYIGLAGLLLHLVSPASNVEITTGAFGPGVGDQLAIANVFSAVFADHPVATPVWLKVVISTWTLLTLVPNFSLMVRRLHDANFSGFWALVGLIPTGGIVLVIMALRSSQPKGARFDRLGTATLRQEEPLSP